MIDLEKVDLEEDSDDDVCRYVMKVRGRLILDTVHGTIIIDVRALDVNAFTFSEVGLRVDHLLIPKKKNKR